MSMIAFASYLRFLLTSGASLLVAEGVRLIEKNANSSKRGRWHFIYLQIKETDENACSQSTLISEGGERSGGWRCTTAETFFFL